MKKQMKVIVGTGVALSVLGSTPLLSQAESAKDYIVSQTNAIQLLPGTEEEGYFNNFDPQRLQFYREMVKKIDPNGGNRLYKYTQGGVFRL